VFKDSVLDKVKIVPTLPHTLEVTLEMSAEYYEVDKDAIESVIRRNRQEFNEYDEVKILKGRSLTEFKKKLNESESLRHLDGAFKGLNSLTLVSRRGLLRIGMLLTQSLVAQNIRDYLLNVEQISPIEQRKWAADRIESKNNRRQLTDAIRDFYEGSLTSGIAYAVLTNMVYKVLFDTDAEGLRKMYDVEKGELLRDYLSTEDLESLLLIPNPNTALYSYI
jgi:predicted DNA-binding protein YlxM (UPF0122 family)